MTTMPRLNIAVVGQADPSIAGRTDLIIGQLENGDDNAGKLFKNVQLKSESEIDALFGARTDLRHKILSFLKNNRLSRLDVQTLEEDGSAIASTATIEVSGSATADGEIEVSVVSEKLYKRVLTISGGETNEQIATKIKNAFETTVFTRIPVTSSVATDTVTFTSVDKGTVGNFYSIKVKGGASGVSFTVVGFANGANNPVYTSVNFPAGRYTGVSVPQWLSGSVDNITSVLDARYNSDNAIMDGVAFMAMDDTVSNINTFALGKNSKALVLMGNGNAPATHPDPDAILKGKAICHPTDWAVCEFAGIRARRLTAGAPIADFVTATGLDNFGGPELASFPYFNTPMKGVPTTQSDILFINSEIIALETAGYGVIGVNTAETGMLTGSMPTTYKTDDLGNEDATFRFLEFVDTGSVCREYIFNKMKADLAQMRLTEGDIIPGRNIQNKATIKGLFMGYIADLADAVLVQAGKSSEIAEKTNIVLSLKDRLVTITSVLPIVTQIGTVNMVLVQKFTV